MTPIEELDLLLTLIRKYDLPLSPILEYAVTEKKEENASTSPFAEDEENDYVDTPEHVIEKEPDNVNIVDFNIPENADTTTRNKYLMQFCYGILSEFKDALTDREKEICNMLLVENSRRRASDEYQITEERVRQIYVKSIKKISHAHKSAMQELEALRKENEELKSRNYLLETEMRNSSNLDNVLSLQELEENLCYNAKRLLAFYTEYLPFSNRTTNVLRAAKVEYFKDIPQLTLEQVQKFRNCGRKTITELREFMSKYSLDFGMTYEGIITRMSKYVDDDFDSSIFVKHNARIREEIEDGQEILDPNDNFDYNEDFEESSTSDKVEIEHVFLDTKGEIEGSTSLPICSENRSGMPWSSDEEEIISRYFHEGHSFYAIGKAIGRTEVAVMSRLGMLGLIEYTYGQDYKPIVQESNLDKIEHEDVNEVHEFNGMELAEKYYYPLQDNLFWDENEQVYEIYLADNYDLIINHLIFDFDKLNKIDADSKDKSEEEKEVLYSNYWYDNHINIIARIKQNTKGYDALKLDTGIGIQSITYEPEKYVCINHIMDDEEIFIDYNGTVYESPDQIMALSNTEVAKFHNFYDAPNYVTKEYIRFGMIEIKRIYKGSVKKVTIFAESDLGQAIKNNTEEIWMIDSNTIITKISVEENNSYPFKVYFRNGVKIESEEMDVVKEKSLILQAQLKDRINKLQSSLKKKKEWIRYERQFKEIASTMFAFEDESDNSLRSDTENEPD